MGSSADHFAHYCLPSTPKDLNLMRAELMDRDKILERQCTVAVLRYELIFRKLGSRIRTKAHQASMAHAKASGPQSLSLNFAKMDTTSQNFFYPEWISSE